MKRNGFTLIELLAVIVILVIIALIATPIILGIINDARKESQEKSIELYASAVRNAIASYQLNHPNAPTSLDQLTVEYEGKVECDLEESELYEDGTFYLAGCKVNDGEKEYTYGTKKEVEVKQVYKPQYYSWSTGSIGESLPLDATKNVSELNTSYPYYLGLDVDSSNKVSTAYVCFTRNETEYCLKGSDAYAFDTNNTVLEDAFKDVDNACDFFAGEATYCNDDDGWSVYVDLDGNVDVYDDAGCKVLDDGTFECYE